ncbi:MAG: PIN domain-containing protein [Calditrichaeota bacterium]|nr:MAG: PIN domain-containing protein [Calditrichota bacterium]
MKIFFDSSAFAKRYIEESGSAEIDALCQKASSVGLSVICIPEIISALNRRKREQFISPEEYQSAKEFLASDVADCEIIGISEDIISASIKLLENNTLRAMDALHVAGAILWESELFITADHRQAEAAKHCKFETVLNT